MELLVPSLLLAALLFSAAVAWLAWHLRCWQQTRQEELSAHEFEFRWRQFRRRMQTSGMLGLLAVAISIGPLITSPPWLVMLFWGGVVVLAGWVFLLALTDMIATRLHFSRLHDAYRVEQIRLEVEKRRLEGDDPKGPRRAK